ncbi:MAG: FHA domain-containing protein [Pirellulaceae bacterium]|nr:FHA domain-containing protein [Planctomycetaceae bacterium]HIM30626.1 FHA domain-containing protein [Planctomycetota bacterium]
MAQITLRVIDGADRGRVYERETPISIGREEGNSIQLNDDRISRFHIKVQDDHDQVVLTDLESTNGTKVNGEDVQLRILRHGDMITLGRSILLLGTREQIEERLRWLAGAEVSQRTVDPSDPSEVSDSSLDFDLGVPSPAALPVPLHSQQPPTLPTRLTPGQAAQLTELLEYLHVRIRHLLNAVEGEPAVSSMPRVSIDFSQWQMLLDLQARLAEYLRGIGEPNSGT